MAETQGHSDNVTEGKRFLAEKKITSNKKYIFEKENFYATANDLFKISLISKMIS